MIYYADHLPSRKLPIRILDDVMVCAWDFLQLPEDLTIEIEFVDWPDLTMYGDADVEDGIGKISVNRGNTKTNMIATIFHEMVHVRQILSGDLIIGEGDRPSKWMGQEVLCEYRLLPWEQEAYKLEDQMVALFNSKALIK